MSSVLFVLCVLSVQMTLDSKNLFYSTYSCNSTRVIYIMPFLCLFAFTNNKTKQFNLLLLTPNRTTVSPLILTSKYIFKPLIYTIPIYHTYIF